jgi:hypothetical protein
MEGLRCMHEDGDAWLRHTAHNYWDVRKTVEQGLACAGSRTLTSRRMPMCDCARCVCRCRDKTQLTFLLVLPLRNLVPKASDDTKRAHD